MPFVRYIIGVGGFLLVLLLLANACLPQPDAPYPRQAVDKPVIRILSMRKGPERVVIDTSLPTIVPATADVATEKNQPAPPEPPGSAASREAFAQLVSPTANTALPVKDAKLRAQQRPPRRHLATARPRPAAPQREMADVFGFAPFWIR